VVTNAHEDERISRKFLDALAASEFVIAPLASGDRALGVIVADNLFSGNPITDEDVRLLEMFSAQAGQALANAKAYQNLRDTLSELEDAYRELEGTQKRLVRAEQLAAVGTMAARVAHEIRNPLTTVGGFARTIVRNPGDAERSREHAQIIVDEVDRLELILRNLLNLARPQEPMLQVLDVNEVVRDTATLLGHDFDGETLRLTLDLGDDLPPALGDRGQLKQAFLNISKNAAVAMPDGGELVIRTSVDGDSHRIDFRDTGIGIDDDIVDKVFEPFFSTRTIGSGIGLAVTRQIVEEHGGRIEVSRNPDRGSTFTIWLPVHRPEATGSEPEES
ncbi:MAG: ATP-binding protein, partial [Armatimonadota bacterium]